MSLRLREQIARALRHTAGWVESGGPDHLAILRALGNLIHGIAHAGISNDDQLPGVEYGE